MQAMGQVSGQPSTPELMLWPPWLLEDACCSFSSALHIMLGVCKTEMVKMVPYLCELTFLVQDGKYVSFDLFAADAWNDALRRILRARVEGAGVHWLLMWAMHQERSGSLQTTCVISGTIALFQKTLESWQIWSWQMLKTKSMRPDVVSRRDCSSCMEKISLLSISLPFLPSFFME